MSEYRIPISRPWLPPFEEYSERLREVWLSRQLSNNGPFVQTLERQVARSLETPGGHHPRVLAVANGDIGLICAIAALELPPGARVAVPSFTFQSTINAILWNQLVPVFVDIDPETFCVDWSDVAKAISGISVAAVVATDVFGVMADRCRWAASLAWNLPTVFDCAHSLGSWTGSGPAGLDGAASVFSLSGTKVVTGAEGGLVVVHNDKMAARVARLRNYGFLGDYNADRVGVNGKMSELHAALAVLTVERVSAAVEIRRKIARLYREGLADLPDVTLQRVPDGMVSTYKDFAVLFVDGSMRAHVAATLDAAGIQTKRYFRPLHQQAAYEAYDARKAMTVTDDVHARLLCLPIFEEMTTSQVAEVVDVVEKAVRS